jgi:hypothetical protein
MFDHGPLDDVEDGIKDTVDSRKTLELHGSYQRVKKEEREKESGVVPTDKKSTSFGKCFETPIAALENLDSSILFNFQLQF